MENVVITAGDTRVEISPLGAELQSVSAGGVQKLWSGDKRVWSGRAPILFPFCGGLKNDGYFYNGARYDMPKHGFARKAFFRSIWSKNLPPCFPFRTAKKPLKFTHLNLPFA